MSLIKFLDGLFSRRQSNLLTQVERDARVLIVGGFRSLAEEHGIAPSDAMSDDQIIAIYSEVGTAFRHASKVRREQLSAGILNRIVLKFPQVYEGMGADMYRDHLRYEVQKYQREGLREDYRTPLDLW